jgi:hypothetical protein
LIFKHFGLKFFRSASFIFSKPLETPPQQQSSVLLIFEGVSSALSILRKLHFFLSKLRKSKVSRWILTTGASSVNLLKPPAKTKVKEARFNNATGVPEVGEVVLSRDRVREAFSKGSRYRHVMDSGSQSMMLR